MRAIPAAIFIVSVSFALAACGATSTASSNPGSATTAAPSPVASPAAAPAAIPAAPVVKTGTATVSGTSTTVLTDAQGLTLYYKSGDGPTTVTCTGGCAASWPPVLLASGTPTAAGGATGALTIFAGPDGRQVLYNGHPLYLWVKDSAPGQATGQNLGGFKVVTPDIAVAG